MVVANVMKVVSLCVYTELDIYILPALTVCDTLGEMTWCGLTISGVEGEFEDSILLP